MIFKRPVNIVFVFFALLAFSACEETVVLDLDFESNLVINSFFDSNSPWAVEVSKSGNLLDQEENIELIENAKVTIYDQDNIELYELYHIENGIYGNADKTPESAKGYYVKVEVGPKVVTAYSYVPEKSILKINHFSVVLDDKDEGIEVDFQIEDKSNLEAYFIWEIVSLEKVEEGESVTHEENLSDALINNFHNSSSTSETEEIEIINSGIFGDGTYTTVYNTLKGRKGGRSTTNNKPNSNSGNLILDESFNIEGFDDTIVAFDPNGDDDEPIDLGEVIKEDPKFELRVVSISKEFFDWYNSVNSKEVSNDTKTKQIRKYTNVENGLGVFAGFNESIIRF
jgi:hypothetical protein